MLLGLIKLNEKLINGMKKDSLKKVLDMYPTVLLEKALILQRTLF